MGSRRWQLTEVSSCSLDKIQYHYQIQTNQTIPRERIHGHTNPIKSPCKNVLRLTLLKIPLRCPSLLGHSLFVSTRARSRPVLFYCRCHGCCICRQFLGHWRVVSTKQIEQWSSMLCLSAAVVRWSVVPNWMCASDIRRATVAIWRSYRRPIDCHRIQACDMRRTVDGDTALNYACSWEYDVI